MKCVYVVSGVLPSTGLRLDTASFVVKGLHYIVFVAGVV